MKKQDIDFLVFGKPSISKNEITEMISTLESGWIGTGPKTKMFEDQFSQYVGSKNAIALNSCTAGLHIALDLLKLKEGDEVITTPMTFASTVNVIEHHNAKPIFVDIDKWSMNLNVELISNVISKRTRAIMPVHFAGLPCDMDKINAIARDFDLCVISDAAHAIEAKYKNKKIGHLADLTVFSFYANKNLTTGEGGMIVTDNDKFAKELRIKALHGLSADAWKRYSNEGFKPYEILYPGYKYNMTDMQASLGIHQLKNLNSNLIVRMKFWRMYDNAFSKIKGLINRQETEYDFVHARHLYIILIDINNLTISRNQFVELMKKEGIGTGVHYTAIHLHPFYKNKYRYKRGNFENAEWVSDRTVSLPLTPYLKERDILRVIEAVKKILKAHLI